MLNISTEPTQANPEADHAAPRKASLKRYVLEKLRIWVNSLLEAERDEFLGRGRHQPLDENHDNYRNGYRPRTINFFGLGEVELRVWVRLTSKERRIIREKKLVEPASPMKKPAPMK